MFREAELHEALSSATRIEILGLLRQGPMSTMELARELSIDVAGVRSHLEALRLVGLVSRQEVRRGKGRPKFVYQLEEGRLLPLAFSTETDITHFPSGPVGTGHLAPKPENMRKSLTHQGDSVVGGEDVSDLNLTY